MHRSDLYHSCPRFRIWRPPSKIPSKISMRRRHDRPRPRAALASEAGKVAEGGLGRAIAARWMAVAVSRCKGARRFVYLESRRVLHRSILCSSGTIRGEGGLACLINAQHGSKGEVPCGMSYYKWINALLCWHRVQPMFITTCAAHRIIVMDSIFHYRWARPARSHNTTA